MFGTDGLRPSVLVACLWARLGRRYVTFRSDSVSLRYVTVRRAADSGRAVLVPDRPLSKRSVKGKIPRRERKPRAFLADL